MTLRIRVIGLLRVVLVVQAGWLALNGLVLHHSPGLDPLGAVIGGCIAVFTLGYRRWAWTTVLVRVVMATDFLLAVADRFGLLGRPGSPGVSWGDFTHFVTYTRSVAAFAPASWGPTLAVAATAAELSIGVALLLGARLHLAALAAAALLTVYGISMTISLPPAQQFHYNVFLLCAAMLALSFLGSPLSIDRLLERSHLRAAQCGGQQQPRQTMAAPRVRADVPTFGTPGPRTVRLANCPRTGLTHTLSGVTHRFVLANGLRFHLAEAGTHGQAVLLLHGFPQHGYAWRRVIADLAADHRVYALDLRGAGQSDAPRRGYDSATLASDVLAVLEALGLPVVQLIGHEWGGWLGFTLALTAPERFSSFVAVNTPHPWLPHRKLLPQMWRYWYTALLEYPLLGAWVIRTLPGVLRWLLRRGRAGLLDADVDVFVDVARQPARARAGQQLHWQIVLRDIPRQVFGCFRRRHLTVPTLLLAGSHDFALSARSLTDAGRHADQLRVRVLDGGHYLPEERPDQIADAARELTQRLIIAASDSTGAVIIASQ